MCLLLLLSRCVWLFETPWTAARQTSCPSLSPRVCSNSGPLSQWCHPIISSSPAPFSSCLPSFPASGSFSVSWFFTSGGQSIGASASASVLPMNIQDWFLLGFTGWVSLQPKGLSRVFSNTIAQKHQFFSVQPFLLVQFSHPHMATGKTIALTRWTLSVMSLLFDMLFRFVITFLQRSKYILIPWLKSPFALILELPKIKSVAVSIVSPSICHEVMEPDTMILVFWMLSQLFHSPLWFLSRGSLVLLYFLP